jgi:hypothetical protein
MEKENTLKREEINGDKIMEEKSASQNDEDRRSAERSDEKRSASQNDENDTDDFNPADLLSETTSATDVTEVANNFKLALSPTPTTMVVDILLDTLVDYDLLFWVLPVLKSEDQLTFDAPKRSRFKKMGPAGSILSVRCYDPITKQSRHRGLIKDNRERKKDFENCVEIDMSLETKNVNFRLFKSRIHMCGANSHAMVKEVLGYLTNHLESLQNDFRIVQSNQVALEAFIHDIKGEEFTPRYRVYHKLKQPVVPNASYRIYLEALYLMESWEEFMKYIKYINKFSQVFTGEFKIKEIQDIVTNYNYTLGFPVNRSALAKLAKGKRGFFTYYNKAVSKDVSLNLPVGDSNLEKRTFKKSDKEPCHTFKIKKSGSVKQAGPSHDLCCEAYKQFCLLIKELKPDIIKRESEEKSNGKKSEEILTNKDRRE